MIRFIYFDLGNVLLRFDHALARRNMARLTNQSEEVIQSIVFDSGLQDRYEEGAVSCDEFHHAVCESIHRPVQQEALLFAASDMFAVNQTMLPIVTNLVATNQKIGILSNTCKAHWDFVNRRFRFIRDFFAKRVLSFEERALKPKAEIYNAAITAAKLPAEQIFFMDDRAENVRGATRTGLQAVQFVGANGLAKDMQANGIPLSI